MRNAVGLMAASVVSAALIAAIWFWTASPRLELAAAPATVKAAQAERLPASAKSDDSVEVTAAIVGKPATPGPVAAPAALAMPPATPCTNPNALGVSRTVEIDTTGGPGFGVRAFQAASTSCATRKWC